MSIIQKLVSRKGEKKTDKMVESVAIQRAKKRYKEKYGEDFSPSLARAEMTSGIVGKKTRDYDKIRKEEMARAKKAKEKVWRQTSDGKMRG